MTAVQNFTGLAELRTTSVEEKGDLCVRGRRHDIMHDAFDEIRHETYSKFHFQQRVSTVLAFHPTKGKLFLPAGRKTIQRQFAAAQGSCACDDLPP